MSHCIPSQSICGLVHLQLAVAVCDHAYAVGYEDFFCKLIAKACKMALPDNPLNFSVDNVRVCKVVGAQVTDSEVVPGMVIDRTVEGADCAVLVHSLA